MNRSTRATLGLGIAFMTSGLTMAADGDVLLDEPSRAELARYAMSKDSVRAIPRKFEFPKHVVEGKVYGIDVSHHQGKLSWEKIAGQGVSFAYVKATQGKRSYDGEFGSNWAALKVLREASKPILRGAYHFMSAVDSPNEQAANFIAKVGRLDEHDLPPCLDLEWDFLRENKKFVKDVHGNNIDQWNKVSAAEIVRRAKVWLAEVEKGTGKKPLIYTNAAWWKEHVGNDLELKSYKLWIADYTSGSLNRERPRVPKDFSWVMWQVTDVGILSQAGLTNGLDTNVLTIGENELASMFR